MWQQFLVMCACVCVCFPGSECKVPAGVLIVSLELYPPLTETLSTDIISTQVSTLESLYPSVCLFICSIIHELSNAAR